MNLKITTTLEVIIVLTASIISETSTFGTFRQANNPERSMTTAEIIRYHGYPAETHVITTADGYIIEIHRIPRGVKRTSGPRTPVMVQHGLLGVSAEWVVNLPNQSLGFVLADAGYDVWLTNIRGNTYGRNHTFLNPDNDPEFWYFTWDQMADFDIPAHINYILNLTKYNQLYYIGYSMGCTMMFTLLSTKPEFSKKIRLFQALAPVTTVENARSPLMVFTPIANTLTVLARLFGVGEFLPSNAFIDTIAQHCDDKIPVLCQNVYFLIQGWNERELNQSRLDVYLSHFPAGTSSFTPIHYIQGRRARQFRRFNWGPIENLNQYGQITPPLQDLRKVNVTTNIYWGANDLLSDPRDVRVIAQQLPRVNKVVQVGDQFWSHHDFQLAMNAATLLYNQLIREMPRF